MRLLNPIETELGLLSSCGLAVVVYCIIKEIGKAINKTILTVRTLHDKTAMMMMLNRLLHLCHTLWHHSKDEQQPLSFFGLLPSSIGKKIVMFVLVTARLSDTPRIGRTTVSP